MKRVAEKKISAFKKSMFWLLETDRATRENAKSNKEGRCLTMGFTLKWKNCAHIIKKIKSAGINTNTETIYRLLIMLINTIFEAPIYSSSNLTGHIVWILLRCCQIK
jgi:hypothetical protein